MSAVPQIRRTALSTLILGAFLFGASLLFWHCEPTFGELRFHRVFLFSYTTLATIGYGRLYPTVPLSRFVCTVFVLIGTPLFYATLSQYSHYLNNEIPTWIVLVLMTVYSALSGIVFYDIIDDNDSYFTSIYFGFITVTTIGFGDVVVSPSSALESVAVVATLSGGIVLMSTLLSGLCYNLRRIRYVGRGGIMDTEPVLWVGGAKLRLDQVLELVCEHYGVSVYEMESLAATLRSALSADELNNNMNKLCAEIDLRSDRFQQVLHALVTLKHVSLSGQKSFRNTKSSLNFLLTKVDVERKLMDLTTECKV